MNGKLFEVLIQPNLILVFIGAVSEPKLSVIRAESAGVTLQCEANCWLPKPEIKFLDDQGNIITADDPKRDQEPSGCHTVKQTLTLQDAPKRYRFSLFLTLKLIFCKRPFF